jgi:hypothetical protein
LASKIDNLAAELTIREAAEVLGVCQKTVRRYLADGSLIARNAAPLASRRPAWRIPLAVALALRGCYQSQCKTRQAHASGCRAERYEPKLVKMVRR